MENLTEKYDKLLEYLEGVNPELRASVERKYEEDRVAFTAYINEKAKDKDKSYWSKRSCKKCYGTGSVGKRDGDDLVCPCTDKGYTRWLAIERSQFLLTRKKRDDNR